MSDRRHRREPRWIFARFHLNGAKAVPANIAGQVVNKTQGEILAQVMMKNAITTKQASHIALLLKFMEAHENRLAALEAVKLKQVAEASVEIDWDDEKEKAYQELVARAGKMVQLPAPTE